MAIATKCQTPGAKYHTSIQDRVIGVLVELPFVPRIGEAEAERLEANIHNALELALAPYFVGEV